MHMPHKHNCKQHMLRLAQSKSKNLKAKTSLKAITGSSVRITKQPASLLANTKVHDLSIVGGVLEFLEELLVLISI